jgi:CRP-like cAMP-binding protein
MLQAGAHFGEISVIFGCKRTATVVSDNYCTIAMLSKKTLQELQVYFEKIFSHFKNHVVMYQDDLKIFLEMELDKIDWFKDLSIATKNEIIYSMEREEKSAGSSICASGTKADRMYLV